MPRGTDRYDEARLQGRLWTPAQLRASGKLFAWYDPRQSPITFATGVSQMNDLSGRGNHATQATTTMQPAWSPANKWGRPALKYDGSNDALFPPDSGYNGTNGLAGFVAFEVSGTTGNRGLFGVVDALGQVAFYVGATNYLQLDRYAQTVLIANGATPILPEGFNVAGFVASTSLSQIWANGVLTQSTVDPAFASSKGIGTIGLLDHTSNSPFNALMGEAVILTTSPTDAERTALEGYLAWGWNAVSNLVATHKHKNRPPLIGG